jgi:hypothetical protein
VKTTLSKSQYVKGLQCPKALWFYRNRKDLAPEISPATQALFDLGDEIGVLAQKYFEDGVEVTNKFWDVEGAVISTEKFIADGYDNIYEATAIHPGDGSFSRIDILHKASETEWDLIEVKSSTQVKKYHLDDLSLQYHAFSGAGYNIRRCKMMVINNQYKRDGKIDINQLFKLEDITEKVLKKQNDVEKSISKLVHTISAATEPIEDIGARCFKPFECDYKEHCWKDVPDYSVFNIYKKKKAESIARSIDSFDIQDVPSEMLPTGEKLIDVASYLSGEPYIVKPKIIEFLRSIEYPCYYLDYETVGGAIPLFNGVRPYETVPFQFSLHVQQEPNGVSEHFEFLHQEKSDPRLSLAKALLNLCGDSGSVIVYNQSFEKGCNNGLATSFPELANDIKKINDRMIDLLTPFKSRFLYHPAQKGSASIKAVLPAFTDQDYNNLEIGDGMLASRGYQSYLEGKLSADEADALMKNLQKYCKLDTYAMVKLVNVLSDKVRM